MEANQKIKTMKPEFKQAKKLCTCKQPNPATKCSENGIFKYCLNCAKEFEWKNWFKAMSYGKQTTA